MLRQNRKNISPGGSLARSAVANAARGVRVEMPFSSVVPFARSDIIC